MPLNLPSSTYRVFVAVCIVILMFIVIKDVITEPRGPWYWGGGLQDVDVQPG